MNFYGMSKQRKSISLSPQQAQTGFPLEKYLKELTCPVLWIQKTNDPAADYQVLYKKF